MITTLIVLCIVLSITCIYLFFLQRKLKRLLLNNSDKEKEKPCEYCKTTDFVHKVEVFPPGKLFCSHHCLREYRTINDFKKKENG